MQLYCEHNAMRQAFKRWVVALYAVYYVALLTTLPTVLHLTPQRPQGGVSGWQSGEGPRRRSAAVHLFGAGGDRIP